ncbi:hypothetical protein FRB94_010548 [Tulasnella sp. JGI-2019a]|nr:hypothetical protein FRB94_010548 [Tulasnella sp. JGI-2019a]KAG9017900.1 hypothetical protein FRB93_004711 [Tulasnella sp. JGI-2019a]
MILASCRDAALFHSFIYVSHLPTIPTIPVIRYQTAWGRTTYEVRGSTKSYRVFTPDGLKLPATQALTELPRMCTAPPMTSFCSCPAFANYVLNAKTQLMCKHLLAVRLAERMDMFVDRTRTEEDLVAVALATLNL